jgi:aspartyl/glutamyl-tRNA(Asn/Gln) amidotransferase C subunit
MSLNISDIKHVAALSKLGLSAKELKNYGSQLGAILDYVGQLSEVDTDKVETALRLGADNNVWGADKAREWDQDEVKIALSQVLAEQEGQIKVPRVLE